MGQSPSDAEIIAAVLGGDSEPFGEIVLRYRAPLWRAARSRLHSLEAADDAVQETFLCAFKWLASYDSRYSFRTWLWTILLNQCRRSLGKTARRREHGGEAEQNLALAEALTREACPQEQALLQERAAVLERLLGRLPEPQADALRLRFFGDLKFQEIADVLHCSLATAKKRVRTGLLQLARWLGDDDVPLGRTCPAGEDRESSEDSDLPHRQN